LNAVSALYFIAAATVRNALLRQLRRARQPRYLVAMLFGLFYFVNVFVQPGLRSTGAARRAAAGHLASPLVSGALTWLGMLIVLYTWVFGGYESGLAFSEAEIQFLFPAPLTRRQLVHYKLARTMLFALVSALVVSLGLGRRIAPGAALFPLGAWLGMATLSLHLVAASLTRMSLLDHGVRGPARRALSLALPLALASSIVAGVYRVPDAWPSRYAEVAPYAAHLLATPPLSWAGMLLAPAVHVALAPTWAELGRWLPVAALVLGLHYRWALSTDAAFEQASIAAAERRGKRLVGLRRGRLGVRENARPPFALSARGSPAFAIYWKNLTAAMRLLTVRMTLFILLPTLTGGIAAAFAGAAVNRGLCAILCAALALSMGFFGVQIYRIDFRLDLVNIDLLRSYPLRGVDLALAEVLAPFTVLTLGQWIMLLAAAVVAPPDFVEALGRLPLLATAMVALPALTLSALIVQNAAALLFPGWVESGSGPPRGIEAIGQRLLTLVGTLLVVTLALIPAAILGGLTGVLLHGPLGQAALPASALAGAVVVAAEAGAAFFGLGRAFERFDPGRP
jgi:ABC-2 type transport system permease protein